MTERKHKLFQTEIKKRGIKDSKNQDEDGL